MDPATFFIASFDIARPLDVAGAASWGKDAGVLLQTPDFPPRRACIPLSRPGTGCTLMLESLVMALVRQMPLKEAAAILRNCDTRLWRLIEVRPDRCATVEVSGKKEVNCLNLFYDLDTSFSLQGEDGVVAKAQAAEQTRGRLRGGHRDADSIEFAKALLAGTESLLQSASRADDRQVIRAGCARGKVSAETAFLYPSQSRAPPCRSTARY